MINRGTKILRAISPDKKDTLILIIDTSDNSKRFLEGDRFIRMHPDWTIEELKFNPLKVGKKK